MHYANTHRFLVPEFSFVHNFDTSNSPTRCVCVCVRVYLTLHCKRDKRKIILNLKT
jgi:hypothetical protein